MARSVTVVAREFKTAVLVWCMLYVLYVLKECQNHLRYPKLFVGILAQHPMSCNAVFPKPETLNPKPETLNPKPETLNPKPQTVLPCPSAGFTSRRGGGVESSLRLTASCTLP